MRDEDKTKKQLISELMELRRQVAMQTSAPQGGNGPGPAGPGAKREKGVFLDYSKDLLGQKKSTTEFIENVLANIIESIVVTDLEGRLIFFNKFSEELFGYRANEVLSAHIVKLGAHEPDVLGHIRRNEPFRGEIELKTKDGRRFPAHVRCVPLTDESDLPSAWSGSPGI